VILDVWQVVGILVVVLIILGAGRLANLGGRPRRAPAPARQRGAPPPAAPTAAVPVVAAVAVPVAAGPDVALVIVENKCPSCNTLNPTGQVFCGQCGSRLTPVV